MRGILIGLALALVAPAASAQTQHHDWCYSGTATDDQTIDGCSALILWCFAPGLTNTNDQAIEGCTARETSATQAATYYNRGHAYEKMGGLRDEAIADYRAALKINPNLQKARDGLTRLGVTP